VEGTSSVAALAPALHALLVETANGALTWSEATGEATESISRLGASI